MSKEWDDTWERRKREESARQKGGDDKATKRPISMAIIGVCAAIILRNKNMNMNLVQHIISLILNTGHASKQVSLLLQSDYITFTSSSL